MKKILAGRCYLIKLSEEKIDFHKESSFYWECEKQDDILFAVCKKHPYNVEEEIQNFHLDVVSPCHC